MPADGVLAGEVLLCELVADDDRIGVVVAILVGEEAPLQQRNLQSGEIVGIGETVKCVGQLVSGLKGRVLGNCQKTSSPPQLLPGNVDPNATARMPGMVRRRASSSSFEGIDFFRFVVFLAWGRV